MKKIALFCVVAWGVWFYHIQQRPSTESEGETEITAHSSVDPLSSQTDERAPSPPNLAPDGTKFLLSSVSITTDSGVIGFYPGTTVLVIADKGNTVTVRNGEHEFDVAPDRLTNDIDRARNLLTAALKARGAAAEIGRKQRAIADARELQKRAAADAEREAAQSRLASQTAPLGTGWDNPLNRGAYGQTKKEFPTTARIRSPYSEKINTIQARINEIERPLLYEQVKELSESRKAELQELRRQLDTFQELERIHLRIR